MPKINEIYAFIAVGTDPSDEGIVAWKFGDSWVPLVGADMARIESLRPLAQNLARTVDKSIILTKFSLREDLEEIR